MSKSNTERKLIRTLLSVAVLTGLTGCLGGESLNTETAVYIPDDKPLNVIGAEDVEAKPGDQITLTARLVGTVNGETLMWTQTAGTAVEIVDPTSPSITFTIPSSITSEKLSFMVAALNADGSPAEDANGEPLQDDVEVTVFDPDSVIVLDVSDPSATLSGATLVRPGDDQFVAGANGDVHTADLEPGETVIFNIDDQSGFFTLNLRYVIPSDYGGKVGNVTVNGVKNEVQLNATGQWTELRVGVIKLDDGPNTIEVGGGWNYYRIDGISMIPAAEPAVPLPVAPSLVNENATEATQALMAYITDNYLTGTISGQAEFPNGNGDFHGLDQADIVIEATGDDAPAIVSFDYMRNSPSRVANGEIPGNITEDMIKNHQDTNVVLSPMWHWNAPMHLIDSPEEPWWKGFYASATTFDLGAALADTDSPEYQAIISDIDVIAAELKKLADADIPVLWRPLHEADGDWFWWSMSGPQALKDLWVLMYDRMTNEHGLNNLIWVFSHSDRLNMEFYPGDDYVDIVGFDGYDGNNDQNPFVSAYNALKDVHNGKKVLALTETGAIPDVSLMHENNAWWSYFVTWNSGNDADLGPEAMDPAIIDANYAFDAVINRADLPGGVTPVGPGMFNNFDGADGYVAQVNWSNDSAMTAATTIYASTDWAAEGTQGLKAVMNLTNITDWPEFPSTVIQTYPEGGIDVSEVSTLTLTVNSMDAGEGVTGKLWVKHSDDWLWADAGATPIEDGGTQVSIDVSEYEWLAGFGVQFEGFATDSAMAAFAIDQIKLDGDVYASFEQNTTGFHAQWDWSTTEGDGMTTEWSAENAKSLVFAKDLSQKTDWGDFPSTVMQVYPEGGIDVSSASALTLHVNVANVGDSATAKLWVKHGDDWLWADAGAMPVPDGGTELSIDVSEYDWLAGFGVQYEGFDIAATDARFYLDGAAVDGSLLYDFEQVGQWHAQADWVTTTGATLTEVWGENGTKSIMFNMDLSAKTDWSATPSTVLQVYPEINVDGISALRLTVNAMDAGEGVTAKLFVKHGDDWAWVDAGATPIEGGGTMLEIDCSEFSFIAGWGVQFENIDTTATDAKFFIDSVEFVE